MLLIFSGNPRSCTKIVGSFRLVYHGECMVSEDTRWDGVGVKRGKLSCPCQSHRLCIHVRYTRSGWRVGI